MDRHFAENVKKLVPVHEWREPSYREFRPRNLWSLFNAFTEIYKGQNPNLTLARSEALHGLCDGVVGLAD